MVGFNRFPTISIEQRIDIVKATGLVHKVLIQKEMTYDRVLEEIRPDYVVHGDNWKEGHQLFIRENVLKNLKKFGGELIEIPYTYNEKVKRIDDQMKEKLAMPEFRRKRLHQLLSMRPIVKALEVSTCNRVNPHFHYKGNMAHYVTANEGAAVGMAIGSFLASGKPACVYMQNSGIGNAVNPLASLANGDVYGIPVLFIVGWRGELGTKDEPQHVFQGKITCELLDTLGVASHVIDKDTSENDMLAVLKEAVDILSQNSQFALIVKKGTFEKETPFFMEKWEYTET